MTYPFLASVLVLTAVLLDTVILKTLLIRKKRTWIVFIVLCILTIVFDTLLVGLPIVTYTLSTLSGIYIGLIPIEDFSYAVVAVLVPLSVQAYLSRKTNTL